MSRRTQRVAVAVSAVLTATALLLAACAATDQPASQPSPTFSTDVSASPGMQGMGSMPAMSGSPSATEGGSSAPAAPAGPNEVNIDGFAFAPVTLTVKAGTTVTWTNKDEDPHTVVDNGGAFRSQALGSGGTYSFTFPTAGTFDYICSVHPFMHGTVVVTP
ncbi:MULTISPECIES: cupredoxin family copper-binding protein [unclassified Mycobacterium]|uniref:cupredoxin domain-containing protein n=1 Tax=unclassified Mycobacterium TaxID=2642494 RepID=UPI0029C850E3|nr:MULTISPECIES: cupredoxin family copper-binding protein [unclassified Mycobacterium]